MSRGDPVIGLLKILVAYWRKQFRITAPGLRKHGYRPIASLEAVTKDFKKEEHDPSRHGERIADRDAFRSAAERMEGSRDVGAQLFTALIRALEIEARLVASLQPLGFGWTKAETYTPSKAEAKSGPENESKESEDDSSPEEEQPASEKDRPQYDKDLPFPIYWTEVASPVTHEIISVDPLVLSNPVAPTPELQAAFEPRGAKADHAKQVICYVVAYSADGTAKDVTTRYLKRRTWPGKTKGVRMPVKKYPIPGRRGQYHEFDWFRVIMRPYGKPPHWRTKVDELEDAKDLQRKQPEKKKTDQTADTLQSLRQSTEFVLERFLRREEALVPGAEPVRIFTSGKGDKAKKEPVYRRADVVKCMSAESWHKEGRQILPGAVPLKRVPIRSVTLRRKREVDELQRETGEKPMQGLYARNQTEFIIPPPIVDGIIPKNDYGNIDCFVPSMVPQGAAHVPLPGTVRLCKKLGIDYAEAVTGFEFGSKMAVPVIQGVVIAAENEDLLRDAWRIDAEEKRKREDLKAEKRILQTWRKFLFGLRITERVQEEYGGFDNAEDRERDSHNPFAARKKKDKQQREDPEPEPDLETAFEQDQHPFEEEESSHNALDHGGGFLLPGEVDADAHDGLIVEQHHDVRRRTAPTRLSDEEDDDLSSAEDMDEDPYDPDSGSEYGSG
jgi:xeroderma pigmentosum group C-complementing protein